MGVVCHAFPVVPPLINCRNIREYNSSLQSNTGAQLLLIHESGVISPKCLRICTVNTPTFYKGISSIYFDKFHRFTVSLTYVASFM